jgi:uncharacterized protein (TIGR02594 family)
METNAYMVGLKFVGIREGAGVTNNPLVVAMLRLDASWVQDDQTPWCSAFANFVCFILGLPRSRSLAARSWLNVGVSVPLSDARIGYDVVVLKRGSGKQPGADVIAAPGHVGFYAGQDDSNVLVLGGNQLDSVSIAPFAKSRILGIRRLA